MRKKLICLALGLILAMLLVGCGGNGNSGGPQNGGDGGDLSGGTQNGGEVVHTHDYKIVPSKRATCISLGNRLYFTCDCGKLFLKNGDKYTETTLEEVTLPYAAHTFDKEEISDDTCVSEATETVPQTFAKVCPVCGEKSPDQTFTYGKTLAEYASDNESLYTPSCVTVSLYDAENCVYGFTWNTESAPARPILKIVDTASGKETVLRARFEEQNSYKRENGGDIGIKYYVCKAEIELSPDATYTYSVGDKYFENTFTEITQIKTVKPKESAKWTFVHVSDSQVAENASGSEPATGVGTGEAFSKVLKQVADLPDMRFLVHTGDVVEYSKYQSYWKYMLDYNFDYLSKLPVMAISGNHETTYRNGSNETYNRFDYKIPEQNTEKGFYYSFSYGNVKFIMLNTNNNGGSNLEKAQLNWLETELKNKTEKWTVVSMHAPMYSVGQYGANPDKNGQSLLLRAQLSKLFAEYKVDVVLQGHDHMVSRTHPITLDGTPSAETTETLDGIEYTVNPSGTIYVMNGPAGSQTRTVNESYDFDRNAYAYYESSKSSSWAEFTVDGNLLTVRVKNASSGTEVVQKTWGIKKTAV